MAVDLSIEPFFDDYNADNKFYKILFRPSYAVQARELTQLQTILQEQIKRHGDHIFKEGSMVIPGQISYDLDVQYVKLVTTSTASQESTLASAVGKVIKNSSGLRARVLTYRMATGSTIPGSNPPVPDLVDSLYVKYLTSNADANAGVNVKTFAFNDTLTFEDTGQTIATALGDGVSNPITGKAGVAFIEQGVYYIKKHFVLVTPQTIVLDPFSNAPSYRVGLNLEESIVYPEEDESLLDNALGSPNYAAPGAARYYIDLVLSKRSLEDSTQDENFIDLLRLSQGNVLFKIDRTEYAELEKTFARRTYDESGDYTVRPFGLQTRDYRSNDRGDRVASKPYIQGDVIKQGSTVVNGQTQFNYFTCTQSGPTSSGAVTLNTSTNGGVTIDGGVVWRYTPVPVFNRGVYKFDAASTNANISSFTVDDHRRLDGMLAIGIEPSKAYVRGYEIEKVATEFVPLEKSRDLPAGSTSLSNYLFGTSSVLPAKTTGVSSTKTASIDVSMGSYVIASDTSVKFAPDIVTLAQVDLNNVVSASANAGTVIGKARVRGLEKHGSNQYKVFLFDIAMNAGQEFSSVRSIKNTAAGTFQCDFVQVSGKTVLNEPEKTSLIHALPDYAIKEIVDASYSVVVRYSFVPSTTSQLLNSISSVYTFESTAGNNYILIDNSAGQGGIVSLVPNQLTVQSGGSQLQLSSLTAGRSYVLLATVRASPNTAADCTSTVVLQTASENFTTEQQVTSGVHDISTYSYVTRIVSVLMSDSFSSTSYSTNITSRYTFDDGTTPSSIGTARITLKPGEPVPIGRIQINYEYIAVTSDSKGEFLAVNSYIVSGSQLRYDQIGKEGDLDLRDSIDFRPIKNGSTVYSERYFPKYGTTLSVDYTHYLPRIDNISLTSSGKFITSTGIASLNPIEPMIPSDSMKLARLVISPYTFDTSAASVIVDRVENKRYTMRDIGKLERRIEDLEYYTTLNMLEGDTKNLAIIDSSGLDRLKNGFIVDSFDGQGVGNTLSPEWNASVDSERKELRPFFYQKQVELLEDISNSTIAGYQVKTDVVTLPYTEVTMIEQNKSSRDESVNPYALFSFNGLVSLNPWSDTWFSTERRPDVIINDQGQYNALIAKAEAEGVLGTVWNSWQTVFSSSRSLNSRLEQLAAWSTATNEIFADTAQAQSNTTNYFWRNRSTFTTEELASIGIFDGNLGGAAAHAAAGTRVLTIETSAVETTARRAGVRSFVVDKVDSRVLEDRVVETKVVPFIRSRAILFTGFGFKPNTRLYSFFDGVNVDQYITPAIKIKVAKVNKTGSINYPHLFNTTRNAGDKVQNQERNVRNVADLNPVDSIEIAFNHGEVVKEYNASNVATGKSAIVVGQEQVGTEYFIYVLNVRNSEGALSTFSTTTGFYLRGEYVDETTSDLPRVQVLTHNTAPTLDTQAAALLSSPTGLINGIFRIPNDPINRFRTGRRELKFTDSLSNTRIDQSTSGSSFYEANGVIEVMQRTILSTRTAELVQEQISETNTVVNIEDRLVRDTGWFDPLAQTFLVQQDGGAFMTSVDIYFSAVNQTIPVRVELREVVNGYPSSTVLPFSRVEKRGSTITTSTNASVATTFTFQSPVYVQNGVEYALVVLSDSNDYRVWISQTKEADVTTGIEISSQPYNGVLFKSQNGSAWTADQTQDMKFKIKRANFNVSSTKKLKLVPAKPSYKSLSMNPLKFTKGSNKVRVSHANHGLREGDKVRILTRQTVTGTLPFIEGSAWTATTSYKIGDAFTNDGTSYTVHTAYTSGATFGTADNTTNTHVNQTTALRMASVLSALTSIEFTVSNVTLDAYVIQIPNNGANPVLANQSMTVGGAFVSATENYEFQTAMFDISQVVHPGTDITYRMVYGTESYTVVPKENMNFTSSKYISSHYFNAGTLTKINTTVPDFYVEAELSSTNSSISPVVDLGRIALTMVSNKVDTQTSSTIVNDVVPILDLESLAENTNVESAGTTLNLIGTDVISLPLASSLYTIFNGRVKVGSVIRFTYSAADTNGNTVGNYVVTSKYTEGTDLRFALSAYGSNERVLSTSTGSTTRVQLITSIVSEISFGEGTIESKYVTRKINLSRPSELLRIMFAAVMPSEADIEVYYKTGLNSRGDFEAYGYKRATPSSGYVKSDETFTDLSYTVEGLGQFDTMVIKLVMRSTNKAKPPRIKDLRVIACA